MLHKKCDWNFTKLNFSKLDSPSYWCCVLNNYCMHTCLWYKHFVYAPHFHAWVFDEEINQPNSV